jgi:hypothetical protein
VAGVGRAVYDIRMFHTVRIVSLSLLILFGIASTTHAERKPQTKEEATHVVTGVIKELVTKDSTFGGDGVRTEYTAEITVGKVERGDGVKANDTIKATWFHVTKRPSNPMPGAYGHSHAAAKKGETVRVFLMKGSPDYAVIYNSAGIEAVKK